MSWENLIKDRGIFFMVIILLILITSSLDNVTNRTGRNALKKTRATHANRLLTRVHGISPSTATWIKGIVSVLDNLVRFSTFDITFRVICTSIFIKSVSTETEVTILKTSVKESLRSTLVYTVLFRCISFNLVSKSSSIDKVKVVV